MIYCDNPDCGVAELMKIGNDVFDGFGDELLCLADPFHVIYNIVRATPTKHPLHKESAGALTDLFLPSYEDDKQLWIKKLIESGEATESEVNGNFRGSPWRRHCRRLMVTVGDTDGIAELKGNLDKLLKEYNDKVDKNQNSLITPDARKAVKRAKSSSMTVCSAIQLA